jgi:hypothetical protein
MGECRGQVVSRETAELVAHLHQLLTEQVACAREGDLSRVERLIDSANAVVAEIGRHADDPSAALGSRRSELDKLYAELILTLRSEQADVQDKLKRLRRMKTAIGVYRTDY